MVEKTSSNIFHLVMDFYSNLNGGPFKLRQRISDLDLMRTNPLHFVLLRTIPIAFYFYVLQTISVYLKSFSQ